MVIPVRIISKVTGREVNTYVPPRFLLDRCDEEDLVQELTACECSPVGETNVVDCNCSDEWEEYELLMGREIKEKEDIQFKRELLDKHTQLMRMYRRNNNMVLAKEQFEIVKSLFIPLNNKGEIMDFYTSKDFEEDSKQFKNK